ncbi:Polyisoprenoid-binding protein YceI [Mucilaginibacter polytrichastri]|nr:Polyisoprenoid-binding protein YceI [Mucilaginibacter polytrichastri]
MLLVLLQLGAVAQQTYRLNTQQSKILWDARKTMGGHYGYILFSSGSLNYSPGGEPNSGAFTLDMNNMHSTDHALAADNQKVDNELKTPKFFKMAQYPTATINITQISRVGQSALYKVSGTLTIKGITNPVVFEATIVKKGKLINVSAKTTVNRVKWHIDVPESQQSWNILTALQNNMIADEIGISLSLVFNE